MLTDQHWLKLKSIVHNFGIYLNHNLRTFIKAMLYIIRTGCPCRDILESFGKSNTIFKRFTRCSKDNNLLKIFKLLFKHADLEWVFIDASHIRAHQHARGIKDQAISRSIGGNSTKIHLTVDSNGNPIQFLIHDGTTHDVKVAPVLIDKIDLIDTDALSADNGYDSKALREQIERISTKANIPKKSSTLSNNRYMDYYLYKIIYLVWNTFARIK